MSERTEPGVPKQRDLRDSRTPPCTNCKEHVGEFPKAFQGVIICVKCHRIVTHLADKARKQYEAYLLTYFDVLRVALVKGQLDLPQIPKEANMPMNDFAKAMREMGGRIANEASTKASEGPVRTLQGGEAGGHGTVPGRRRIEALPWRGDVREVSPVQEGRNEGSVSPRRRRQRSEGMDGDS